MKHLLTIARPCLAAALVAAIGLSANGCKDTVSVSPDVAVPLSSLTVTPGTLQPAFFRNTTDYAVSAPAGAPSVTVTAVPKDSTAIMEINGVITPAGQARSISLGAPGSLTTFHITLSSQTGTETTYTVNVTRLLSSDNNLSALSVKVGAASQPLSPAFAPDTLDYTVSVQTNAPSVTISATKSDSSAAMLIGSVTVPAGTNPGQASVILGAPGTITPVTIEVTAPNGSKKTYQIAIKRLSGDNNLSALSVAPYSISPFFAANTVNYTVDVAYDVTGITVSATKSDPNAVMLVHSVIVPAGTASGQDTIGLNGPGTNTPVSITVTAQNGVDSKTYTITVHRAAPSSNNNLAILAVTPGSLAPSFAPGTVDYTLDVATTDNSVTVIATLQDANATMLINGQGTSSGQPREISPLQPPGSDTTITIVVIAQNGSPNSYTITVRRPLPSSDDKLSALSVSTGSLNPPFADPNILDYSVDGALNVPTVTVTATKSDPNATMSALGSVIAPPGTPVGQVTIQTGTNTTVGINIIAQDGVTNQTYNITIP